MVSSLIPLNVRGCMLLPLLDGRAQRSSYCSRRQPAKISMLRPGKVILMLADTRAVQLSCAGSAQSDQQDLQEGMRSIAGGRIVAVGAQQRALRLTQGQAVELVHRNPSLCIALPIGMIGGPRLQLRMQTAHQQCSARMGWIAPETSGLRAVPAGVVCNLIEQHGPIAQTVRSGVIHA